MTTQPDSRVEHIALDLIDPDPDKSDQHPGRSLRRLDREHGVLSPVLVGPTDNGRYQLIAGERRYRAALAAGHVEIPASIRTADDATRAVWQAVENLARADPANARPPTRRRPPSPPTLTEPNSPEPSSGPSCAAVT